MSPRRIAGPTQTAERLATRLSVALGRQLVDERVRRDWTIRELGRRARLAEATIRRLEAGGAGSLDAYARLATALGLDPSFSLTAPSSRPAARPTDPVHAAMGETEAAWLRAGGREVLLDEPYQHYQFAGRADVLAIDREKRVLLHIENRTRFPDLQAFAGAFNAKRAYLAPDVARRLGIPGGFRSVTHVVAALWSSEVLHAVRLRTASFAAICPHPADAFATWWDGGNASGGESSTLVLFDPLPGERRSRRRWVGLDAVARVEPRYRGYADALEHLRRAGLA
jgi:transcriptional regulator with XRE-family HTH domain